MAYEKIELSGTRETSTWTLPVNLKKKKNMTVTWYKMELLLLEQFPKDW